jgi:hypothetical protein
MTSEVGPYEAVEEQTFETAMERVRELDIDGGENLY